MTELSSELLFREINIQHGRNRAQGFAVGMDQAELDAFVRLLEGAASLYGTMFVLASTLDLVCDINDMPRMHISKYAIELIERVRAGVVQ